MITQGLLYLRTGYSGQAWWPKAVNPAALELEAMDSQVQGQYGRQSELRTSLRTCSRIKRGKEAGAVSLRESPCLMCVRSWGQSPVLRAKIFNWETLSSRSYLAFVNLSVQPTPLPPSIPRPLFLSPSHPCVSMCVRLCKCVCS